VEEPLIKNDDWAGFNHIRIPEELLSFDRDAVNRFCESSGQFVLAGEVPRPFERLQFIRGSQNLFMDLTDPPANMKLFIDKMHDHYCRLLKKWAQTDVDALNIMDDWGSQTALLINPGLWERLFMPLYRDYIDIAKTYNKKIFMHSDGHILSIIPKLIEMGLDALNTQIFCIGIENLATFKGKITFWGEIDRQYLIPYAEPGEIDAAVDAVYDTLWHNGGCIAQCEFGPMGNPKNVRRIFERWDEKQPIPLQ
jgi:uroporphyrinogen-III decarboxylase